METNRPRNELQRQLHEIERGENASWVVYPPTPAWWAAGFGLWAAALTLTIGWLEGIVQALIELANDRGGKDNITCVIVCADLMV